MESGAGLGAGQTIEILLAEPGDFRIREGLDQRLQRLAGAIELNGIAVDANRKAFVWGRRAAHDLARVEKVATPADVIPISQHFSRSLDETIARRVEFLTDYQDAAYAARYRELAEAVARYYFKLMAYKDEYEVARLYTRPEFTQRLAATFEGDYGLKFHLAPPIFAKPDPVTGVPRKREFGPWMMSAFRVLARLKGLRGTVLDVFGRSAERRTERELIAAYARTVEELLARLGREKYATALAIASIPEEIRGYGHVKAESLAPAKAKEAALLATFRSPPAAARAA